MVENTDIEKEIEKLKKLLALLLYHNDVPPLDIAKAAEISPNDLYKFVTKKKKGVKK
ncbi:MAG: hypothetical protein K5785_09280 [Nitrosarchaeum sp.]|nr:hypothetical protein [Nitrosarchaeum sp.]